MECMELKFCMSDKHHRYYKHTKFRQIPRGDPKFLVDLTWNDPYSIIVYIIFKYLITLVWSFVGIHVHGNKNY